jgi:Tfp pilus assembly protein PilF
MERLAAAAWVLLLLGPGCGGVRMSATIPGVSAALEEDLRAAKRELDAGRPLCAFARVETVRRGNEGQAFSRAFEVVFLGHKAFDPSPDGERALKDALAAHPADASLALELADVYISRADWSAAEPLVAKASALRPDDVEPVAVLAHIRRTRGDAAGAEALMAAFARAHPTSPTGILFALPEVHGPPRHKALETAVASHPDDGELLFRLAAEVQESGDLPAAERLFIRSADLAPKQPTIQAWVGRFFLKAEAKPRAALAYYLRAYFLDPNYYETEFVEERISRLMPQGELALCPPLSR